MIVFFFACSSHSADQGEDTGQADALEYAAFPECTSTEAGSEIDVDGSCVDGLCVGDSYDDVVAAKGEPTDESAWTEWSDGFGAAFDSDDDIETIWLQSPYTGHTADGLGLGESLQCFVDVYGTPEATYTWRSGDVQAVQAAFWPGIGAYDDDALSTPDGVVDTIEIDVD